MSLHGVDVIRTKEPHGLTPGNFVGWDLDRSVTGQWQFSQIQYAEVTKVDKKSLQLKYDGDLPPDLTELVMLRPIEGSILSAKYEAIVVLGGPGVEDAVAPETEDVQPVTEIPEELVEAKRPEDIFMMRKILEEELPGSEAAAPHRSQ